MQDNVSQIFNPTDAAYQEFTDAEAAVARLESLYNAAISHLVGAFTKAMREGRPAQRIRAFYPEIRLTVESFSKVDSRLAFGHVAHPGEYSTTVTRPDLFRDYLTQQIGLLIRNHGVSVRVGPSTTPIPVHFAVASDPDLIVPQESALDFPLRDVFDVPDLAVINDDIVNGTLERFAFS